MIWTVLHAWRNYIITACVIATGLFVFNWISNYGEMKVALVAGQEMIEGQIIDIRALRLEIAKRDERLLMLNAVKLLELEDARLRLEEANKLVDELRTEQERIFEAFKTLRNETLEASKNDEDFADWVNHDVPPVAWSLLHQAAEGRPDN
jgi:hypothetical protein